MIEAFKACLWKNFGAAIDMLSNAITTFPEELWNTDKIFFYNAYHCAVFLDYYLTIPPAHFSSMLPYTLTDVDKIPAGAIDDVVPDRIYSKKELLLYVALSREKCRSLISSLTEQSVTAPWLNHLPAENLELASGASLHLSVMEILFYNLRHVQHHAAQLNFILRQKINKAPAYISAVND